MKTFLKDPKQVRKAITAFIACIMLAVAYKVVPQSVGTWLLVLQPILVAYGVWKVPNAGQEG